MDLVQVQVDLPPGATATYEFQIEIETFDYGGSVHLYTVPRLDSLRADLLIVDQTLTRDGESEEGWPDYLDVGHNERMLATLGLTLTNESQTRFQADLAIIANSGGQVPEPTEEDLRVEIRQR